MKKVIFFFTFLFGLSHVGYGAEIKLVVNSGSRQVIFGNETLYKKSAKKLERILEGKSIKRLGCDEEGIISADLVIRSGFCFGQARSCGYNEVIEFSKYVQTFMNYEIIYVNCSATFISERIPSGQSELTWSDALDRADAMKRNKNIDYIFLVHIEGKYKSDLPDLSLQLESDNKVYAICDGCEEDGKYHWSVDKGKEKKTSNDFLILPKSYQELECYWQNEYGDCKSNVAEIREEVGIEKKECNINNKNPSVNYKNKYVSEDNESKIIHQTGHEDYYILFDSICDVNKLILILIDLNNNVVSENEISTLKLYNAHQKRVEQANANMYGSINERYQWKSELEILKENPGDFLYVKNSMLFDNRYNEVFYLSLEYVLDSGRRIQVKKEKVRFTSCSE